jgi:4-hydroxythreonine-4-phosphate dehydrogenase
MLPVVALTLGDPAGIGPELTAKLLAEPATCTQANVVLVGDPWLWEEGQRIAACRVETTPVNAFAEVRARAAPTRAAFLAMSTVRPEEVQRAQAGAPGGASVLKVLDACLDAAKARKIDAICFAPLNKHGMKQAGLKHDDELHWFAEHLGVTGYFCEFNTLGKLWTSRVSSHIPLKDAASYVDKERIKSAARIIYRALQANAVPRPKVAVAALNPHGGEGGTCGREEIEIIGPALRELAADGCPVDGPFPADTIFLKARAGEYDAVVTMYHDQGQIALKLLGFSQGVTVQGGLPIPITTPAHGTAYDIAGRGVADVQATRNAFAIACRMARSLRSET